MADTQVTVTSKGPMREAVDHTMSRTRFWWLPLIAGVMWILVAMLVLRFDYGTVAAITWLFSIVCFVVSVNELTIGTMVSPSRGWLVLHLLLGLLLAVVGAVALVRPDYTFVTLAAVVSFYFVFRGAFDVASALAFSTAPGWWVLLLAGLAELALGFWAAGSWRASATLLVAWVAAAALVHGVGQITAAFILHRIHQGLSTFPGRAA